MPLPSLDQQFYRDEHLFVNLRQQVVIPDSETVRLTPTQYRLLALLVEHSGQVVLRAIILKQIWADAPANPAGSAPAGKTCPLSLWLVIPPVNSKESPATTQSSFELLGCRGDSPCILHHHPFAPSV